MIDYSVLSVIFSHSLYFHVILLLLFIHPVTTLWVILCKGEHIQAMLLVLASCYIPSVTICVKNQKHILVKSLISHSVKNSEKVFPKIYTSSKRNKYYSFHTCSSWWEVCKCGVTELLWWPCCMEYWINDCDIPVMLLRYAIDLFRQQLKHFIATKFFYGICFKEY